MPIKMPKKLSNFRSNIKHNAKKLTLGLALAATVSGISPKFKVVDKKPLVHEVYDYRNYELKQSIPHSEIYVEESISSKKMGNKLFCEKSLNELLKKSNSKESINKIGKILLTKYPTDKLYLYDLAIELFSKNFNVDPIILKTVFRRNQFSLDNPVLESNPERISSTLGFKITKNELKENPLLGILSATIRINNLSKKYGKDSATLLSYYLKGSNIKPEDIKRYELEIIKYKGDYWEKIDKSTRKLNGLQTISLMSNYKKHNYKFLSIENYKKLSKLEQRREIERFLFYFQGIYNFDIKTISSIIEIESHFTYDLKSPANAIGLMQLKESSFKELLDNYDFKKNFGFEPKFRDLKNPYLNLFMGIMQYKYLEIMHNGNLEDIIKAYNGGSNALLNAKNGDIKMSESLTRYWNKFLGAYRSR